MVIHTERKYVTDRKVQAAQFVQEGNEYMAKQMITECDWLYREWHPTKNKGLDPSKISVGSNMQVWWLIHYTDPDTGNKYDLEWKAEIRERFRNHSKCPYLTGNAVLPGFNDLQTKYPQIAAQWHPEKNGNLTPDKVLPFSNMEVWWLLPYDDPRTKKHFDFEWMAPINFRTKKNCGCPFLTNKRLWSGYNDLSTLHPDLAAEWNVERNGMEANEVIGQSTQKYWWIQVYDDEFTGKRFYFEWEAAINARVNGSGNPYLTGRLLYPGFNDLATRHPEIASEWHPVRNGDLTPDQVFAKDSRRVWWYKKYYDTVLRKEFAFEWETTVGSRTASNSGCPYLSGRALWPGFNDLATRFPELAKEWDYEKNGGLTPEQVMPGARIKVWWKILYTDPTTKEQKELSWQAPVANRTKGMGCPYLTNKKVFPGLNDLATTHPHLALQWHPLKNGTLTPEQVTYGCSKQVWWYLEYYDEELGKTFEFEWKASVNARTNRDTGCPYLSNAAVWTGYNDLKTRYPEIAAEWDYERNGNLIPEKVIATSNIAVWWKIPYINPQTGQTLYLSWQTRVSNRTISQTECPYLTNTAVYPGLNDLETQYPEIASQWHPFRNGILKPNQVFPYDKRSVWWYLPYDDPLTGKHFNFEWKCTIQSRVANKNGCPYVSGAAVWPGYNDLATTYPEIAAQWNYEKNGELTPDQVSYGSGLEVWWILPYDDPLTGKHFDFEWKAEISSRTSGRNGCPYLTNEAVWNGYNDLQTCYPEIAAQWSEKNRLSNPMNIYKCSLKKVWWKCHICGTHWRTSVNSRTARGTDCPVCAKRNRYTFFN